MINESIESPFSNGRNAALKRKSNKLIFRKDEFEVIEHFYVCEITGEEFTTSELDRINLNQVYNQFRTRNGLPFPDQIKAIRHKYGISAIKMSEILGFGANSYRLYEQGEIPSISNGRLIMAAEDPLEFKKFLFLSKEIIEKRDLEKLENICNSIIKNKQEISNFETNLIFNNITPNEFTGYRVPMLEKISHMIMFFSANADTWITKLNKLLFYSDFLSFKNCGSGISGLDYRAIERGPVPTKYGKLYELIGDGELLERKFDEEYHGYSGSFFEAKLTFNELLFDSFELEIMHKVANKFKTFTAKEIMDYSHLEDGWTRNIGMKELISYKDYAFYMKSF